MEIISLLRNMNEKPSNREEFTESVNKINLEKYQDSLTRIARTIPFNINTYIDNLKDDKVNMIIKLL